MSKKPPKKSSGDGVGYCRPPKAHRFKPGQSGNPKGRPKGVPTLQEAITREAAKLVKVKQGGRFSQYLRRRSSRQHEPGRCKF